MLATAAAVLVVGVVVALTVVLRGPDHASPARTARVTPTSISTSPASQPSEPSTTVAPRSSCDRVRHGFTPRSISVPGATRAAGIVTPPRDAAGIPGTPPLTAALGNRLLAVLHRGDRVVVRGDGVRLCYQVTDRVEVPASTSMPRYYRKHGPPQLAILTCSGTRLGPGVWTMRTVWFASPVSG